MFIVPSSSVPCSPEAGAASRITVVEFFQFALDIANALEFLANNLYVHRDVAARNCLGMCSAVCAYAFMYYMIFICVYIFVYSIAVL